MKPMVNSRIQRCQAHLRSQLERYLPYLTEPALFAAMQYACLNGGKRLRPLFIYTTAELFDTAWEVLDPIACAIELIHTYSLIHDDLPAMDNDDLRRGKPTCHKAFGEATAILAGDALLTLAFELLSNTEFFSSFSSDTLLKIIQVIAKASGLQGMVKGQALDMAAQACSITFPGLMEIHQLKTGALITASIECAALATNRASLEDLESLRCFGQHIGLAFQIHDDILDALGSSNMMGKLAGQDVKQNKATFVTVLGLDAARHHAQEYYHAALSALDRFGSKADPLRALSAYVIERSI